eukprot:CAMPEP_0115762170 /NCGR_PEP_ID=MMETSP0272-20121206/100891_1 /TAXON_ID=71861 /ORGANISM="Scrippsiella trochoidea, Strain CCMP3099" /LENGTH=207 /DNA_ID=CAMNT_0003207887 /DNA_START=188 /DNA_END=811 /DNA_ORIENTATION=+
MPSFGSAPFAFYNEIRSNRHANIWMGTFMHCPSCLPALPQAPIAPTVAPESVCFFPKVLEMSTPANSHSSLSLLWPSAKRIVYKVTLSGSMSISNMRKNNSSTRWGLAAFMAAAMIALKLTMSGLNPSSLIRLNHVSAPAKLPDACAAEMRDVQLNTRVSGGFEPPLRICKISSASSMVHQYVERPHVWHHFHFNRTLVPAQWGIWI